MIPVASESNRRIFERIPCDFPVKIRDLSTNSSERVKGCDLSGEGMGILAKHSLPLGKDVMLDIRFSEENTPLSGKAKVMWSRQEASGWWRIGVNFSSLRLFNLVPILAKI